MAHADLASASVRSDSIKGLAQSIAKPAYRRLLSAEPVLRRAVPVLIVVFLLLICFGAGVQVTDYRRQADTQARQTIEAVADQLAVALDRPASDGKPNLARTIDSLPRRLPEWAAGAQRRVLFADGDGMIIASIPDEPALHGRSILDVLGPWQAVTTMGAQARTMRIDLPNGEIALASVRALKNPAGMLAVLEPVDEVLAQWRSTAALTITLAATTGFVVLILGFAFHWQATRAREADLIHDTLRSRI